MFVKNRFFFIYFVVYAVTSNFGYFFHNDMLRNVKRTSVVTAMTMKIFERNQSHKKFDRPHLYYPNIQNSSRDWKISLCFVKLFKFPRIFAAGTPSPLNFQHVPLWIFFNVRINDLRGSVDLNDNTIPKLCSLKFELRIENRRKMIESWVDLNNLMHDLEVADMRVLQMIWKEWKCPKWSKLHW